MPNSIRGAGVLAVNFQAFSSRFSSAIRSSWPSPTTVRPGRIFTSTCRPGSASRMPVEQQRDEPAQVHVLLPHLGAGDPGQIEHVVDQLRHLLAGLPHAVEIAAAVVVQPVALTLLHRAAEALDPPERRPQVVGDGVAEALQLPVLVLQVAHQLGPGLGQLARLLLARLEQLRLAAEQLVLLGQLDEDRHLRADELRHHRLDQVVHRADGVPADGLGLALVRRGEEDDRRVARLVPLRG